LDSDTRVGFSNCIPPIPCCCTNSSTSAERGQPLFGSSRSSIAWPVDMVVERDTASSLARQTFVRRAWSKTACSDSVTVRG
jgi:hypothetical protein